MKPRFGRAVLSRPVVILLTVLRIYVAVSIPIAAYAFVRALGQH